jgi:hypothetical protein
MNIKRLTQAAAALSLCLWLCAWGSNARLHPVRGEMYFNGKPAHGAVVHLHPRDKEKGRPHSPPWPRMAAFS